MNVKTIEVDGKKYVASPAEKSGSCEGCDFRKISCLGVYCLGDEDTPAVIYKEITP